MIIKRITKLLLLTILLTNSSNATTLKKCEGKRIISQSPYITHLLDFFQMKECIVGASIYDLALSPELSRTGQVLVPDKEAIKKLSPDFVFLSDWTEKKVIADTIPPNSKGFMLHGFQSMKQIENSLYAIGNTLEIEEFQAKVENFSKEWRELAHSIDSQKSKVLLMSACSKDPYSYGRKTFLGDLFVEAGFDVVDRSKQVKVFKSQNELDRFIEKFKPEFIFGFVSYTKGGTCSVLERDQKLSIVYLNGDLFLHPAPVIIEGLKELKSKEDEW